MSEGYLFLVGFFLIFAGLPAFLGFVSPARARWLGVPIGLAIAFLLLFVIPNGGAGSPVNATLAIIAAAYSIGCLLGAVASALRPRMSRKVL